MVSLPLHALIVLLFLLSAHLTAAVPLLSIRSGSAASGDPKAESESHLFKRARESSFNAARQGPAAYNKYKQQVHTDEHNRLWDKQDYAGAGRAGAQAEWHRIKAEKATGTWVDQIRGGRNAHPLPSDLKDRIDHHEKQGILYSKWSEGWAQQAARTPDPAAARAAREYADRHQNQAQLHRATADEYKRLLVRKHGRKAVEQAGLSVRKL